MRRPRFEIASRPDEPLVIHRSDAYRIDFHRSADSGDRLAFTFTEFGGKTDAGPGYGGRFLLDNGFDVIAVKSGADTWYQDLPDAAFEQIEHAIARSGTRYAWRAGYGSSMGAYAAIAFSRPLLLDAVAAVSPQVDITQPWDTRWAAAARRIGAMRALDASSWRPGCRYVVMFDPWDLDAKHYAVLEAAFPPGCLLPVRVRFAGHPAGFHLSEIGRLKPIALAALTGASLAEPCRDLHRLRSRSATALFHLAGRCLATRKLGWADQAITAALRLRPLDAELNIRAALVAETTDLGRAIGKAATAVALNPRHPVMAFTLSRLLLRQGLCGPALHQIEAAIGLDPGQSLFRDHRDAIARALAGQGQPVPRQVPSPAPPEPAATIRAGRLDADDPLRNHDAQASHPETQPMDYVPALRDAQALRDDGQLDAAMSRFEALAAEHPHRIEAFLEAGKLAQKRGASQDALAWYRNAMGASRHNFWPYYLSVKLKQQQNDYPACLEHLETAGRECRGRVLEEEYDNIVKLTSDIRTVANGPSAPLLQSSLLRNTTPIGRTLPNAVRVSLVKDEADVIYESLESSYLSGFRYYAIADNNSSDDTRREIDRFAADRADCIVYVVSDPVVGYFQAAKTMALARMAVTVLQGLGHPIEWVFALDADEMLYASDPSHDLFGILGGAESDNKRMLSLLLLQRVELLPAPAPRSGHGFPAALRPLRHLPQDHGQEGGFPLLGRGVSGTGQPLLLQGRDRRRPVDRRRRVRAGAAALPGPQHRARQEEDRERRQGAAGLQRPEQPWQPLEAGLRAVSREGRRLPVREGPAVPRAQPGLSIGDGPRPLPIVETSWRRTARGSEDRSRGPACRAEQHPSRLGSRCGGTHRPCHQQLRRVQVREIVLQACPCLRWLEDARDQAILRREATLA